MLLLVVSPNFFHFLTGFGNKRFDGHKVSLANIGAIRAFFFFFKRKGVFEFSFLIRVPHGKWGMIVKGLN